MGRDDAGGTSEGRQQRRARQGSEGGSWGRGGVAATMRARGTRSGGGGEREREVTAPAQVQGLGCGDGGGDGG